jgi:hypothetical protein
LLELIATDERDDLAVERPQLPQLATLPVRKPGAHLRALDVEVRLRQVEVRRHGLEQTAVLVVGKRERVRLVFPRQARAVEELGELALGGIDEARRVFSPEMAELHGCHVARPDAAKRQACAITSTLPYPFAVRMPTYL